MKTYIASGENLSELEKLLEEHEIQTHLYKHIDAMSITTDMEYETLQELCTDYTLRPEHTDYDTQKHL